MELSVRHVAQVWREYLSLRIEYLEGPGRWMFRSWTECSLNGVVVHFVVVVVVGC